MWCRRFSCFWNMCQVLDQVRSDSSAGQNCPFTALKHWALQTHLPACCPYVIAARADRLKPFNISSLLFPHLPITIFPFLSPSHSILSKDVGQNRALKRCSSLTETVFFIILLFIVQPESQIQTFYLMFLHLPSLNSLVQYFVPNLGSSSPAEPFLWECLLNWS